MANQPPNQPYNLPYPPDRPARPAVSTSPTTSGAANPAASIGGPSPPGPATYKASQQEVQQEMYSATSPSGPGRTSPYRPAGPTTTPGATQQSPVTQSGVPTSNPTQPPPGQWPTAPTPYTGPVPGPTNTAYGGTGANRPPAAQTGYGPSDSFAMGNVAASLPSTGPQASGKAYNSPPGGPSSTYGPASGAAAGAAAAYANPPPSTVGGVPPQGQSPTGSYLTPQSPQYGGPPATGPGTGYQSGQYGTAPGQPPAYGTPGASPAQGYTQPGGPPGQAQGYGPPGSSPGQGYTQPGAAPGQQGSYMSGPPTYPGSAPTQYPPTQQPQNYGPPIAGTQACYAGQAPNTVRIDNKEYLIPPWMYTILTPTQCDPLLKEQFFGPYLRYKNLDLQRNLWMGSILLVVPSTIPPPKLEFHPSGDVSKLKPAPSQTIWAYDNWSFIRYDLHLPLFQQEQKWTYAITTQQTQTWEFVVAGQQQQWRFLAFSSNDFSSSVKEEDKKKLGFETVWKDVMELYVQERGYHCQLGAGGQISADRMWKEIPFLIEWLGVKGKDQRQYWPWNRDHEEIMRHAYFFYYTSAFSRPYLREAIAKIPHIFQVDDSDIFDGFGSYPHHLQQSHVFQGIGRIALDFYLIFQHHTTRELIYKNNDQQDLITASGAGWSFIKYLGPSTVVFGLDIRSERDKHRIVSQQNYDVCFNRLRNVAPGVSHCIVLLAVPIVYPRLEVMEDVLTGVSVAKKGLNSAFNLLDKAVTSVAPSSAQQKTHGMFDNVKKSFGKTGLMSNVVSKFGDVEILDDLMDHWTHANHERERTVLVRTLQEISYNRRMRVTFLSGDVHCCGVGYFYDPQYPMDHKLMFQIITSAIVDVPPPAMVIKLLHNNQRFYLPPLQGSGNTKQQSDTKEEMMDLFAKDVDGRDLGNMRKLLPRRNYALCRGGDGGVQVWEICVESGRGSETVKYGPIIIPRLQ